MKVRFVADFSAVRARYGNQGGPICDAIEALGSHLDVSRLPAEALRKRIWKLAEESVCLVGGYALLPTFVRDNPTGPRVPGYEKYGDTDAQIPTDGPYGADPKDPAGELIPTKAISRIPDGEPLDAASFLKTLLWQKQALTIETRTGSFEKASEDLAKPARAISAVLRKLGGAGKVSLSPRDGDIGALDLTSRISDRGRIHLLLHGSNQSPQWSTLFGRILHGDPKSDTRALSAPLLDLCDLRGALVVLTSCYGAMLDDGTHADRAARSPADQVALATLAHGAKAVFGATRSNWIDLQGDKSFGPGLTAHLWKRLGEGRGAAEALRKAKHDLHDEIVHGARADVGFGVKTLLQAHCFGHPLAQLPKRGASVKRGEKARSRKAAPGTDGRDSALEIAKRAVPEKLHTGAIVGAPAHANLAREKAGHPLTEHLLEKHAATLREANAGDADVLFREGGERTIVVQVRDGKAARVLTRA